MTKAAARVKTPAAAFSIFTETQAGMSYRLRDEGAYLCLRLAFPSFSLERKGTKVQGRLHRTSPPGGQASRPPLSVFGVPVYGMIGSRLTAGMEEYVE